MQRSNLLGLLAGMALAVLRAGCGTAEHTAAEPEPSTPESAVQTVEKEPVQEINGIPLRENKDLYSVYDDSGIVTMYLTVSSGNEAEGTNHTWAEINHYSVYDYEKMGVERYQVNGLLQVGDENGPVVGEVGYNEIVPNATVQIRGQTSSTNDQKNYKIELKKGKGTWRGQRTIALNKHMGEGLRFRNKMAYDLIEGIPQMTGLRTQFVHLYVRDLTTGSGAAFEDYGLYTQVEQLNKTALKTHGLDRNGQLYKVNSFEFQRYEDDLKLTTDPDYDEKKFEQHLETKGSSDHTKLLEMLQVLNDDSIPMEEILGRYFNAENIAYWMAFQLLTGNVDTQNRIVIYDIMDLGRQLKTMGLLIITDAMLNRVTENWRKGKRTHLFIDEFHVVFQNPYSADFFDSAWRRFRKRGAYPTAITQNVEYLLDSVQASTMLSNSEMLILLNQAPSDREKLAALLNISPEQTGYITNAPAGCGLLRYGGALVPFKNQFPKDTELYRLMTTKPDESIIVGGNTK